MKEKEFLYGFLHFSRRERIGILCLVALIVFIYLLPVFFTMRAKDWFIPADTGWVASVRALEIKDANAPAFAKEDGPKTAMGGRFSRKVDERTRELSYFDPNTVTAAGWKKLGLRDKTIRTIRHYIDKGGRFREARDLQKIYGLFPDEYARLAPYVKISAGAEIRQTIGNETGFQKQEERRAQPFTRSYDRIDINRADTTAFISLPGIGSKLASRIVSFRDKLGGFYSVLQVAETYGLPDSTFQKIKRYLTLENATVRKIDINTATADELRSHPYFRRELAVPIIAYRNEHGPFARLEDIRNVQAVTEEVYSRIVHYLRLEKQKQVAGD